MHYRRHVRFTTTRCIALATRRSLPYNNTGVVAVAQVRAFSSDTTTNEHTSSSSSLEEIRTKLLESSLQNVHHHGWTENAISAAVTDSNLPLSVVGLVTPKELISYFMRDCQTQLEQELETTYLPKWRDEASDHVNLSDRLFTLLKLRLQYVIPYVKSNRWHEGMALGATTNAMDTARELDKMVQCVADAILVGTNHAPLGMVERTAIGVLYVSTELHLLGDDSQDYQETWSFLQSRIRELDLLAQSNPLSGDSAVAASAVATSLGGAVVSLFQPAARGAVSAVASTVIPQLATFLQTPQAKGTRASDYNVPPTTKSDDTTTSSVVTNS